MDNLNLLYRKEERIVAELERLGIRYLSRQTVISAKRVRSPQRLLSELIQQPSSRVRTAVIAILLAHPQFAGAMPGALERLSASEQQTLKLFYTAAVVLQRKYALHLQGYLGGRWQWLPDWYSQELTPGSESQPDPALARLGMQHRQLTGIVANWAGTYENVALQLLRRWDLEKKSGTIIPSEFKAYFEEVRKRVTRFL